MTTNGSKQKRDEWQVIPLNEYTPSPVDSKESWTCPDCGSRVDNRKQHSLWHYNLNSKVLSAGTSYLSY